MANKFGPLVLILISLLSGCGPNNCPDCYVTVPTSDSTLPTVGMDIYDPDIPISINQSSQPTTVIAVSDAVSVLAQASDLDGGVKTLSIWATYTYYKPGQISGPGLVQAPVKQYVSNATTGGQTLKSPIASHKFELKQELGGWSRIKVDIWIEAENFYGGKVQTPVVSLTYPTRQAGDTDYMAACRRLRVPIPPDWAQTGTAWVLQGNLRTGVNLLKPGEDAFVWTYNDPIRRGACIALPRQGGLAGFICQSAESGHACFWDNIRSSDGARVDWNGGQKLIISELKDGSNLAENCTACHRGNNVFLMAPDDPTWQKVLKGPLVANPNSTFTTRIKYSSDVKDDHPRYIPVTYPSNRPVWQNTFQAGGCGGSCHEYAQDFQARGGGIPGMPLMPPACAVGGDVENCYK